MANVFKPLSQDKKCSDNLQRFRPSLQPSSVWRHLWMVLETTGNANRGWRTEVDGECNGNHQWRGGPVWGNLLAFPRSSSNTIQEMTSLLKKAAEMAESFVSCQSIFYPVIMVKNICMYNWPLKLEIIFLRTASNPWMLFVQYSLDILWPYPLVIPMSAL